MATIKDMGTPQQARRARRVEVTDTDVAELRRRVETFERRFGVSSAEMFDAQPPRVADLEETEELHDWFGAWVMLSSLTQT